jgi:hypothetical protein
MMRCAASATLLLLLLGAAAPTADAATATAEAYNDDMCTEQATECGACPHAHTSTAEVCARACLMGCDPTPCRSGSLLFSLPFWLAAVLCLQALTTKTGPRTVATAPRTR